MCVSLRASVSLPLLASLLAACGSVDWQGPPVAASDLPDRVFTEAPNPTVSTDPAKALALAGAVGYAASRYTGPAANLGVAGAAVLIAYVVYDPLAPNWTIAETMIGGDVFRLSMRAKSFRTGGDGESGLILKRRAMQLQQQRGYSGYRILDYSEGIESSTPFAQRYAEGSFQLVRGQGEQQP